MERVLSFRFIARDGLRLPEEQRVWRSEHGSRMKSPWHRLGASPYPSLPPPNHESGWWGERAERDRRAVIQVGPPLTLKRKLLGLLKWAARSTARTARLVRDQQAVSVRAQGLLSRVGQYPLITTRELAIILGQTYKNVALGLKELQEIGLIAHPNADEAGYVLAHHGLALLAAQAGMTPTEYAKLRRWPVRRDGRQVHYAVDTLLICRAHTRLVMEFLVGLRRCGPRAHLKLLAWDHVQCIHEFPSELVARARKRETNPWRTDPNARRVIPDANGIVRAYGATPAQYVDKAFWLEVDRHTEKGKALMNKLNRFYRYCLSMPSWPPSRAAEQERPRLLIVVERDDESRLQALRRRLLALNQRWRMKLDVRLTRVDLLDDGKDRLDPTRKAWRTLDSDEFIEAFDRPSH